MSDPFDRLRNELGDVPVPDQWPAIEARAAAGDLPDAPAGARRARPIGWWAAAAAALALIVTGVVVLANRQTADAPAQPPGETMPAPSPTATPPPSAMRCASETELDAAVRTISAGLGWTDDPPWAADAILKTDAPTVLVADAVRVTRAGEFVRLELAGAPTYLRGEGPVDAVSWRTPSLGESGETAGPDPLRSPVALDGVRVVAAVVPLSSSPVWSPVFGGLVVGCAGTDVPAVDTHNMAQLRGEPSIDELVRILTGELPVPSSAPPTAPATTAPETTMPCTREADVDAIRTLLRSGVAEPTEPGVDELSDLLGRVDVAFRARLTSATRGADGTTFLHFSGVEVLAGEAVNLTSIGLTASWADGDGPDPFAAPVAFDNVDVVVFARYAPGATTNWVPDPQGVFVGCADGAGYVRPVLAPAPFLDHSSLDALAAEVVAEANPGVVPWGRPCTDRAGTSAAPADDPLAERPFGPLAPEPALTVLYPIGPSEPRFSPPTSTVMRVPGGLLIRLRAIGPEGGDEIIAVVDDNGSVRWRRCLADGYGYSIALDGDVVHVEFVADEMSGEREWWSFDLATGASTIDAGPPESIGGEAGWTPPELYFHVDGSGVRAPLSRRAADARELWRRDDLTDPGGEGFRASEPQPTAGGDIVLVRACMGPRSDSIETGQEPCPHALLGIDPADGSTIWQLDGSYSVPLVADGYAIVTPRDDEPWRESSTLIDLATGATVPDGVPATPRAFYEECCGGYDYNRVESTGGLAWSIAFDRLHLWFPAGVTGPGTTVDLLGPSVVPAIAARFGMPVFDVAGCGVNCRLVLATGSGFTPQSTVTARCHSDRGGEWSPVGEPQSVVVSPDGSFGISNLCADGRDDGNVKVVIGEVESNVLVGG